MAQFFRIKEVIARKDAKIEMLRLQNLALREDANTAKQAIKPKTAPTKSQVSTKDTKFAPRIKWR